MYKILGYMQKTLKNRITTRTAKLNVIENAWFKFLGNLKER
jgi:hypothetical protein